MTAFEQISTHDLIVPGYLLTEEMLDDLIAVMEDLIDGAAGNPDLESGLPEMYALLETYCGVRALLDREREEEQE